MHKNDILMIRIGIIVNNTEKNNNEFIVCKRITSVNIINRNKTQLCANYVQVHVKLMQSLLLRQKSQILRNYLTSRYHTILTGLFQDVLIKGFWKYSGISNCR